MIFCWSLSTQLLYPQNSGEFIYLFFKTDFISTQGGSIDQSLYFACSLSDVGNVTTFAV